MPRDRLTVRLRKTGGPSGVSVLGRLAKGTALDVAVPADIGGEQEAKIRARRMMERDHPGENQMEWEAEMVEAGAMSTSDGLGA